MTIQQMLVGTGIPAPVSYVSAGSVVIGSATNFGLTVPVCAVGDLLLAYLFTRSVMLTVPSGWTLVDSNSYTDGGVLQYVYLYSKTAVSGDISGGTSYTWVQTTSNRGGGQIAAFRKSGSTPTVLTTVKTSTTTAAQTQNMAVVSGTASGQMGLALQTRTVAINGAPNTISVTSPFTLLTPSGANDLRLYAAYRTLDATTSTNGSFNSDPGAIGGACNLSALLG